MRFIVQELPGRMSDVPTPEPVAALLARAAQGDESAWRRILALYAPRVFALAATKCSDPETAEEITQAVFASIATKLPAGGYSEQGRFEPWLFRVAMNRIRDEMRRRKRHAPATDPASFSTIVSSAASPTADSTDLDRLRSALAHLSDQDRDIIELRHHAGLSFKQIADMLAEPLGTLLARHHRALRKLKDFLHTAPASNHTP